MTSTSSSSSASSSVAPAATAPSTALAAFERQWAVRLTSRRRDGTPVGTAVSIAVDGDRAYVRTYDRAWKAKRIARDPIVEIAPATAGGRATGPAIVARARLLEGDEARRAAQMLARKHPILHGRVVPAMHRLRGYRTLHFELTPIAPLNR